LEIAKWSVVMNLAETPSLRPPAPPFENTEGLPIHSQKRQWVSLRIEIGRVVAGEPTMGGTKSDHFARHVSERPAMRYRTGMPLPCARSSRR
jgi:hypothetical protein